MMSICRNNSVNSFFGLPPPLEEDHFSQAFHQTLCMPSSPKTPSSFTPNNPSLILNPFKPIRVIESFDENPLKKSDGNKKSFSAIDLMSCTESLGFESSDEMISSFDDLGFWDKSKKNDNLCKGVSSKNEDSSSSLNASSKCCFLRKRENMVLKSDFPPPLTTLGENGKRNFMLKSVRKDGRLEITEVMIERPEFLLATRGNGRLKLHLIQNVTSSSPSPTSSQSSDDDDDVNDDDVNDDEDDDDDETEEIDWKKKIQASGSLRRCFDHHHHQRHVWGPHQNRFVATI